MALSGRAILWASTLVVFTGSYIALQKRGLAYDDPNGPRLAMARQRMATIKGMIQKHVPAGKRIAVSAEWSPQGDLASVNVYRPAEWQVGRVDPSFLSDAEAARVDKALWADLSKSIDQLRVDASDLPVTVDDVVVA